VLPFLKDFDNQNNNNYFSCSSEQCIIYSNLISENNLHGQTMPQICLRCVKDESLKTLVTKIGILKNCTLCGEKVISVDYENRNLFLLVKAILRFHYSEWEYNPHWGGDNYEFLFYGEENIFFLKERALSAELYEDLVATILDGPAYEDYDKGISLFAGYTEDGSQCYLLESIKITQDPHIVSLANRLLSENYFNIEKDLLKVLDHYSDIAKTTLEAGFISYRARIGIQNKKKFVGFDFKRDNHFTPYSQKDISSPPPHLAVAGRINRPGVSFFYCATNIYTAISEVRPHPGDHISLGKFTLKKKAKFFNLSESQLIHFYSSDKCLDSYIPLNTLSNFMNKVIPPFQRQQYSFTQLIADCIRQMGFDGIIFNSTVGDGNNIVLFDPSYVTYTKDEAAVVEVEQVKYNFKPVTLVSDDEIYFDDILD